jgi:hypothetical protein
VATASPLNIQDLNNVTVTSVANNNLLKYDATTSKWINSNNIAVNNVGIDGTTTAAGLITANGGVSSTSLAASTTLAVTGTTTATGLVTANGGINTTTATFTSGKTILTGTTLATAAQGAFESNANNILFTTGNTSTGGGRQVVNASMFNVLGSGATVASGGAFFPSGNPYLIAGHYYKFQYSIRFTKVTAGTLNFSFTNSAGGNMTINSSSLMYNATTGANVSAFGINANAASTTTMTSTGSQNNGTVLILTITGSAMFANSGRMSLIVTCSAGSITSTAGSTYDFVNMGNTSTGNIG